MIQVSFTHLWQRSTFAVGQATGAHVVAPEGAAACGMITGHSVYTRL